MGITRDDVVAYLGALGPAALQELILELEDLWGIERPFTGPMHVIMGALPYGVVDDDEPVLEVVLVSVGPRRVQVMKAIREALPLGLAEVLALVDSAPGVLSRELSRDAAERLRGELEAVGAKVELREVRR